MGSAGQGGIGVGLVMLAACATPDDSGAPVEVPGCIEVEAPAAVEVAVGAVGTGDLTLVNACDGPFVIERISLDDPVGVFAVGAPQDPMIPARGSTSASVRFSSDRRGVFGAVAYVEGPHGARGDAELQARATGPELRTDRVRVEVDGAPMGCPVVERLELESVGEASAVVRDLRVEGDRAWTLSHGLDLPAVLEPGAHAQATLQLTLPAERSAQAMLVVETNHAEAVRIPLTATPGPTERRTETWRYAQTFERDVVVAADRSFGMRERVDRMAREVPQILDAARERRIDLRLGIVVADDGCIQGPETYIDTSFADSDARAVAAQMADTSFELAGYGSNTERTEMLLEAAVSSRNIGPDGCNDSLWRDTAELRAVVVTDEPRERSWSYYVDLLRDTKDRDERVRLHAIAPPYPSGCGGAEASYGLDQATLLTGGSVHSVCDPMDRAVGELAQALTRLPTHAERRTLALAEAALPETVAVAVDGLAVPADGWIASDDGRIITLDTERTPGQHAVVEASYVPVPTCD